MGYYLLIACGLIGPFFLIYYREEIGNTIGQADWMSAFGGIYTVIVVVAILIFFWTLAELTGTTQTLFGPIRDVIPDAQNQQVTAPL